MCLHVCRDTLVYQAVRADSKKHLPRFYKFIKMRLCRSCTDQMDAEKREKLMKRANAFFVAAKASHLEWNASTFTRVCDPASPLSFHLLQTSLYNSLTPPALLGGHSRDTFWHPHGRGVPR
eukprot:6206738-Pleurochrysis_carterae.AAC.1